MNDVVHTNVNQTGFHFPQITGGYSNNENVLDFGQNHTLVETSHSKQSILRQPIHRGIEVQHRNNELFCQKAKEQVLGEESSSENRKNKLRELLDKEYSRIQESMEKSLESIRKYFMEQLEKIKQLFDKAVDERV
jgi:hypothetical protein